MPPQSEVGSWEKEEELRNCSTENQVQDRKFELNFADMYKNMKNFDYSQVIWRNVVFFAIIHYFAVRGLYALFTLQVFFKTFLFMEVVIFLGLFGTTMGAHRLWAHRTFKAKLPLRIILMICQTVAWQRDIYDWVRDHRVHHKFTETEADPHNAKRGIFFAHMGWLMTKKNSQVVEQGKKIDFSDVLNDPVVIFQRKYYVPFALLITVIIPAIVPWYFWGETLSNAFNLCVWFRYVYSLHGTWSVNSFAHWVGNRPFNNKIYPAQNKWVSMVTGGEGWHNYHHAFPYDYRAAELGGLFNYNVTTNAIEFCEKIGLAYDLRKASSKAIENAAKNNGDMSFKGLGVCN